MSSRTSFFAGLGVAGLALLLASGSGLQGTFAAHGAGGPNGADASTPARLSQVRAKRAHTALTAGQGSVAETADPMRTTGPGTDCNNNGIPDDQEIADGTARDLNGNGLPDECDGRTTVVGQVPDANGGHVPSNIDWSDDDPNVVLVDDFSLATEQAITTVRWWGRQLEPPDAPAPSPASTGFGAVLPGISTNARSLSSADARRARQGLHAASAPGPVVAGSMATAGSGGVGYLLGELIGLIACVDDPGLAGCEEFDINGDGSYDLLDFGVLQAGYYGESCEVPAVIATLPFSGVGNTCKAVDNYDEICDVRFDFPGSPDVVYSYTPAADITVDISLCGNSAYDTKLYVYEDVCGGFQSGTEIGCSEDYCLTPSLNIALVSVLTQLSMTAGSTYFIVVDGSSDPTFPDLHCGDYTIDVTEAAPVCGPGNGDCFMDNGTPGCEIVDCCEAVCLNDPFCCGEPDASGFPGYWDGICANDAEYLCHEPTLPECPAEDTLLGQVPAAPVDNWKADVTDVRVSRKAFESFEGLNAPICDIHWWGLNAANDGNGWTGPCSKNPDIYEIKFYTDFFGEPNRDDVVCSYTLAPTRKDTGIQYVALPEFTSYPLLGYAVDLGSCCDLESGWVSIQALDTFDDCLFLWMGHGEVGGGFHYHENADQSLVSEDYDLSLCLTGEPDVSGWFISFHPALAVGSPAMEALGVYYCDSKLVAQAAFQDQSSCDAPSFTEYVVELADCCLVDAVAGGPATPDLFVAAAGETYDLDVQAVTGVRFVKDSDTGLCIEEPTVSTAAGDFWAWHTTNIELLPRVPLSGGLQVVAGTEWIYGPWSAAPPPACGGSNMAFQLLTLVPPPLP